VEWLLPASLCDGQITGFVENDEVEAREINGKPSVAARAGLGRKAGLRLRQACLLEKLAESRTSTESAMRLG
jgi:hypothetical protein